MINEIFLEVSSCDVDNCLKTSSSFVTDVISIKNLAHGFNWEKFTSFTRSKKVVAFMLRMLSSHKHFRGKNIRFTDPTEVDIEENK